MRTWTRLPEEEGWPEWASRVYVSSDGWRVERYYSPGDRYLNRPGVGWELKHTTGLSGWGSYDFARLVDAKEFCDTFLAAVLVKRIAGDVSSEEWNVAWEAHRKEHPRRLWGEGAR